MTAFGFVIDFFFKIECYEELLNKVTLKISYLVSYMLCGYFAKRMVTVFNSINDLVHGLDYRMVFL